MKRSAVAAMAVLAVVTGVLGWRAAADSEAPTRMSGAAPTTSPAPAAGTHRLVGRGRSVVEVPQGWATGKVMCGTPVADTVVFHSEVVRLCLITPADNYASVEIAAYAVRFSPEETTSAAPYFRAELANADDDARIVVSATDKAVFDRIVASYRRLPAEWTTVPELFMGYTGGTPGVDAVPTMQEIERRLARAGLKAAQTIIEPVKPTGGPDTADPAPGTPARRGSTVTIVTGH